MNYCENFAPKSEEKQEQSLCVAIFSQPNSNEDKQKKKNNWVFTAVCAIFIRLIEMTTKTKMFYCTILLLVVLLCDIFFIVQNMFLCDTWPPHSNKDHTNQKKRSFPFILQMEGRWNFNRGSPNLNGGYASLLYNLSTGYISSHGLLPCFIITRPLRCKINTSF